MTPHELPSPPPLLFELARGMVRRKILGGYHFVELLEYFGVLNRTAWYPLNERIGLEVPLWRRPNQLNLWEARHYELALVAALTRELADSPLPVLLVDCGADVGLLSGLLASHSLQIEEVVALEPNAEAFPILARNLARWPLVTRALQVAAADFDGRGSLRQPDHQTSPHSAYLEADIAGAIEVTRIDRLELDVSSRCLALKIDVEGGERAVVAGGMKTLCRARRWVVAVEAHRKVFERTGVDPFEPVRLLAETGLARAYLAEQPSLLLDWKQPYFAQVHDLEIGNLVAVSTIRE